MATTLDTRALHDLAVHAAKWGRPIVSFDAMRQAFFRDASAQYGDVAFFRLYAPKPALFDKSWRLPAIERVG